MELAELLHPAYGTAHERWFSAKMFFTFFRLYSPTLKTQEYLAIDVSTPVLEGMPTRYRRWLGALVASSFTRLLGYLSFCGVTKTCAAKECSISWMDFNHPRSSSSTKELCMVPVLSLTEGFGERGACAVHPLQKMCADLWATL